ncbi:hypothetical protein LCGC14_1910840 [marine sediment metagenome]|uniref:Uncharacterized protein n=1 Tax=marine sediment metagenome TaxID=412755 RepID=A0A0F9IRQ9_9ZZZZ
MSKYLVHFLITIAAIFLAMLLVVIMYEVIF